MSDQTYQPGHIETPPLFVWPLNPKRVLRYLTVDIMVPWGLFWIITAFVIWHFFTPDQDTMKSFSVGWIGLLWLRNAIVLSLVAGS